MKLSQNNHFDRGAFGILIHWLNAKTINALTGTSYPKLVDVLAYAGQGVRGSWQGMRGDGQGVGGPGQGVGGNSQGVGS